MKEEANKIIDAVDQVLKAGYRTVDIKDEFTKHENILSTADMGMQVLKEMK